MPDAMIPAVILPPVGLGHLNALDIAYLGVDILNALRSERLVAPGPDDHYVFTNPSPSQIATAAAGIEGILKGHGLMVPPNIDKIVEALPMILPLLGLK